MYVSVILLGLSLAITVSAAPRSSTLSLPHPSLVLPTKTSVPTPLITPQSAAASSNHATPTSKPLNCSEPQIVTHPNCWIQLDMVGYMTTWWESHKDNPKCDGGDFSQCYQFLNGKGGQDCSQANSHACIGPDPLEHTDDMRVFYALYNIYAINAYFSSYYNALIEASDKMQAHLLHLVEILDPKKAGNVAADDFFLILTAVMVFIRVPSVADMSHALKDSSGMLLSAMSSTPTVGRFLLPWDGTVDSQVIQFAQIDALASNMVSDYQNNTVSALFEINSNFTSFMNFANTTMFSSPLISPFDLGISVKKLLFTFVISQLMMANHISIATSPGSQCYDDAGNPINPDDLGICGSVWVDAGSNTSYSLIHMGDITRDDTKLMREMLTDYTTGAQLFLGAANCHSGDGGDPVLPTATPGSWTPGQSPMIPCLSSVQVCPYNQDANHPEFTNPKCKEQTYFGVPNCDSGGNSIVVPKTYVGHYDTLEVEYCTAFKDH